MYALQQCSTDATVNVDHAVIQIVATAAMHNFLVLLAFTALLASSLQVSPAATTTSVPRLQDAGKIVVFFTPLASHWYQLRPIIEELVLRGHHVKVRSRPSPFEH